MRSFLPVAFCLTVLAFACSPDPTPTPVPTATPTAIPTSTPIPTATPTPLRVGDWQVGAAIFSEDSGVVYSELGLWCVDGELDVLLWQHGGGRVLQSRVEYEFSHVLGDGSAFAGTWIWDYRPPLYSMQPRRWIEEARRSTSLVITSPDSDEWPDGAAFDLTGIEAAIALLPCVD